MCTQHPDNVQHPFFAQNSVIHGDDEIKEAFYSFSHIGSNEQLWDCEGKEVDNFVVKKLLTRYEPFFRKNVLGKDKHLTVRVPNPSIEKSESKIVLEVLESIPRSFDIGKIFYGDDIAPIQEVFVPMVTHSRDVIRLHDYYRKFVIGKKHTPVRQGDISVKEWIGDFRPEDIHVTPLIEDKKSMLEAAQIVEKYVEAERIEDYQRVWLARSDPALNYSSTATVLIEKIALQRLHFLQEKLSLDIYPMLGCGSAPFRGNCRPDNVKDTLKAYPSVQTFTLQSSFRYDNPISKVKDAVDMFNTSTKKDPLPVDEEAIMPIIDKMAASYQRHISLLAPTINKMAAFVPSRRKRKLHVGLFGYSREHNGVQLPRAIKFTASLYSIGLPPELLGLDVVNGKDVDAISEVYPTFGKDFATFMPFVNKELAHLWPLEVRKAVEKVQTLFPSEVNESHKKITSIIGNDLGKGNIPLVKENIERAAFVRGFLG
jgi:phosphoenolpyruvate carboxylase